MQVLSVTSELYPLIKTGGLADVAGALPLALRGHGIETKTLVPGYPALMKAIRNPVKRAEFADLLGEQAVLLEANHDGLDILILDAPTLFDRPGGPYVDPNSRDYPDNWKRFAVLSKAGAEISAGALPGWQPDLVHAHDWQAALTPVFMRYSEMPERPSLLTIHNIAFQGQFGAEIFPYLGLPVHAFAEALEYYGGISYLKGGLVTSHAISTVSPSYAEEILTPTFGMGLEGVIASRADDLYGIVNGIDATVWNPSTDPHLAAHYTAASLKKRQANRSALEARFALDSDGGPIFCVISRLTWQKGMDLLAEVADTLVAAGGKLVILGSGDHGLESGLLSAAARHKGRVAMVVGYNEPLSHLMQAGSDAILIPSRFEPCGLTQLYALRYGCVPVVARTGGLADTIIDANEAALAAKAATGIQFESGSAEALRSAIRRTVRLYGAAKVWSQLQKQGMKCDVSWGRSAERYIDLYQRLVSKGQ
ncbi:glycogen synthase GlgA [Ciceribacter naphthalenivorans]|uniref:Glycogen synthase n=3 Tax=Alphaproteobacteria TaxID=28211 RepID=A0A512HKR3_9HYPH|nr:glycogen synthase GlgA [Ciceribacter naphthalenivorans]GEO86037.1 glycogen synthase 1 [Ciceribacter naphthalenivorans]GLR22124.1 glycogen synthase 1 [Ciceribacter naphthalenivorans]GLT04980.1 glycogen synthase 1 [Sphingomonas psychrolutea]